MIFVESSIDACLSFDECYEICFRQNCTFSFALFVHFHLTFTVCPDHVHMLVEIPPKYSVSSFMGFLKGKSSIMIYEKWGNMKYKYRNREFWCRGYYVDTVGKNTKAIDAYISNQLKEDRLNGQLTFEDVEPFKK